MLVLVDDKAGYTWAFYLKNKSDAFVVFKSWLLRAESATGAKLKVLRSDNGGEYVSKEFDGYLASLGIVHQTTVPHTSQ